MVVDLFQYIPISGGDLLWPFIPAIHSIFVRVTKQLVEGSIRWKAMVTAPLNVSCYKITSNSRRGSDISKKLVCCFNCDMSVICLCILLDQSGQNLLHSLPIRIF